MSFETPSESIHASGCHVGVLLPSSWATVCSLPVMVALWPSPSAPPSPVIAAFASVIAAFASPPGVSCVWLLLLLLWL